ncbi:Double zinc ribbon [Polystyrenella longa]|uniref:Double zinc ribbon n=1 Tax=Polystyrenella longa TaxID=2528007 RepID=A0A518CKK5_9PLAN|nr:zinc ribbon domain-containing protein [Polystyrenella longa]QDU79760.1 Double zinc ribbon [Polystyrenella longa]
MPSWPGGPCPKCGEDMPEKLIHCQTCRALLNDDLNFDSVEVPEFIPLQELESMVDVSLEGYFVNCPECQEELRINRKYVGKKVQCKRCEAPFELKLDNNQVQSKAFFSKCPSCQNELRAAHKYIGEKVACKYCGGKLHFVK